MEMMLKVCAIFVTIMLVSCATIPSALPEKYNLDDDLEAVDQISTFKVSSWKRVGNQSVILRVNWNDYYLIVLRRPIDIMISNHSIGIDSTLSTIKSGYDRIVVKDHTGTQYYVIDKIYKLKGKKQAEEIRERLRRK